MRASRQSVDYSLQRRALLRDVYAHRVGTYEVCDASPYLMSAARFHGEATEERCPICRKENLTHVNYVYGDALKSSAGQARSRAELPTLAMALGEFQVYVVEVCRSCGWNHLVEQYVAGRNTLAAISVSELSAQAGDATSAGDTTASSAGGRASTGSGGVVAGTRRATTRRAVRREGPR